MMTLVDLRRALLGLRRIDHAEFSRLFVACGLVVGGPDYTARAFDAFSDDPLEYVADSCDDFARALLGAAARLG